MKAKISIITVCLNAKDRLLKTLESIDKQSYRDFEVIVKDGGSVDETLNCIDKFENLPIRLEISKDMGIYDAMNQAVALAEGEYVYFLNCGDYFYDESSLLKIAKAMEESHSENRSIFYGNIYDRISKQVVPSNPKIDGFACYRNIPCHQACFYKRELVLEHPFETKYKIRADYEQFLWCFYKGNADFHFVDETICDYEGGGFSEIQKNIVMSKNEHREITGKYMSGKELFKYKLILTVTLSGLRTKIARNPQTAAIYNKIKKMIYRR